MNEKNIGKCSMIGTSFGMWYKEKKLRETRRNCDPKELREAKPEEIATRRNCAERNPKKLRETRRNCAERNPKELRETRKNRDPKELRGFLRSKTRRKCDPKKLRYLSATAAALRIFGLLVS